MESLRRLLVALVWALYLGVFGFVLAILIGHEDWDELHLYAIGGVVLTFIAIVLHKVINWIMMKDG